MKILDVVFGKRITGSNYHINTAYLNRYDYDENDPKTLFEKIELSLDSINKNLTLDDDVMNLLVRLRADFTTLRETWENDDHSMIIEDINRIYAMLGFMDYEFHAIRRPDLDHIDLDSSNDRAYCINRDIGEDNYKINLLGSGLSNLFDNPQNANVNSMIMEFLVTNRIKIGDDTDEATIGLSNIMREYEILDDRNESVFMDTSKVLNMLEKLNYHFFIAFAPSYTDNESGLEAE